MPKIVSSNEVERIMSMVPMHGAGVGLNALLHEATGRTPARRTLQLAPAPLYVPGFSKELIDACIVVAGFQAVFNHCVLGGSVPSGFFRPLQSALVWNG